MAALIPENDGSFWLLAFKFFQPIKTQQAKTGASAATYKQMKPIFFNLKN